MTDQSAPSPLNTPPAEPRKSSKRTLWIIGGLAIVGGSLCVVLCLVLAGAGVWNFITEQKPVAGVLDTFMTDMTARDIDAAYALFSPRSQRQFPKTDLERMLAGNNYVLFEGYQSLSVRSINLSAQASMDENMPQGNVARVAGTITYDGGFTGRFDAVLEKVNGVWMLHAINVSVPPEKFPAKSPSG